LGSESSSIVEPGGLMTFLAAMSGYGVCAKQGEVVITSQRAEKTWRISDGKKIALHTAKGVQQH
jgi:hypothetical protein